MGEHGVALEVFGVPGAGGVEVGRVELVVDDLGGVGGEFGEVGFEHQGLREVGKGPGAFDENEVVDGGPGRIEADLEPVELRVDHDEVIDFPLGGGFGRSVRGPAVVATCVMAGLG